MSASRYVIGIDLGTTNSAVAYIDTESEESRASILEIPQVLHPGSTGTRPVLPSFLYIPGSHELPGGSLALPWKDRALFAAGEFARDHGSKVPHRLISSAKSWLCHERVDRRSAILPWGSPDEVERISPVETSARYLLHMKEAWNHLMSEGGRDFLFENQDIILTVPASFDAAARELTVEAAVAAGLSVTLLEEPQAALYSWIHSMGDRWRRTVKKGDIILVCDVGGGTTDFSVIAVTEQEGDLVLERIAVGDHLMLGGDNMDLAIAMSVAEKLKAGGHKLDSWQVQVLSHSCRQGKEEILSGAESFALVIPGRGSSLMGGAIATELTRDEVQRLLVDGFFPVVQVTERPSRGRRAGLAELGLPYESEAAVTRHLAQFLTSHLGSLEGRPGSWTFIHPTALLFNGGVMKSRALSERLGKVVNGWLDAEGAEPVRFLENEDLDLAVARGASYYGLVRRGKGIRIRGGTARSYYIGLETSMPAVPGMRPPIKALCVAPLGMEEGTSLEIPSREFGLVVGDLAEFRFLSSTTRKDAAGQILEDWEDDCTELASLSVELTGAGQGALVPVTLESKVTEVGTLELWFRAREGDGRWKLEFNVRDRD
jgi:molecular chaperone DnaK (HSP70)